MSAPGRSSEAIAGSVVMNENDVRQALELTPRVRALLVLCAGAATLASVAIPPYIPAGALLFLVLPLAARGRGRAASRVLQDFGGSSLDVAFEFSSAEVTILRRAGSSRSEWSHYRHFTEVPSAFLIYTNAVAFEIVPKRAFTGADIPRLRALLTARLTPPPRPIAGWRRIVVSWLVLVVFFFVIWQLAGRDAGRPYAPHTSHAPARP